MKNIVEDFTKRQIYNNEKVEVEEYLYCDKSYFVDITTTKTDEKWLGLDEIELEGFTLKSEKGNRYNVYMVKRNGITEIVKQSEDKQKIYDMLTAYADGIDPHLLGVSGTKDYDNALAIFETEKEALQFMEDNYAEIDLDAELQAVLKAFEDEQITDIEKEMDQVVIDFIVNDNYKGEHVKAIEYNSLADYYFEISQQHSQYSWYGLEGVELDEVVLDNDEKIYLVSEYSAREIVKQTEDKNTIYYKLSSNEEIDEILIVAIFDTENEALQFMADNYPKIDLDLELQGILKSNQKKMNKQSDLEFS